MTRPLTLSLTYDLDNDLGLNPRNIDVKTWLLAFDLDLDLRPWPTIPTSHGQGRPICPKSRSKDKRFKQESSDIQTDIQTDEMTLPSALSPWFTEATWSMKMIENNLRQNCWATHKLLSHPWHVQKDTGQFHMDWMTSGTTQQALYSTRWCSSCCIARHLVLSVKEKI